jgi:hypothetical protein
VVKEWSFFLSNQCPGPGLHHLRPRACPHNIAATVGITDSRAYATVA